MASIYSCSISDVIRKQGKSMLLWASSDPIRILLHQTARVGVTCCPVLPHPPLLLLFITTLLTGLRSESDHGQSAIINSLAGMSQMLYRLPKSHCSEGVVILITAVTAEQQQLYHTLSLECRLGSAGGRIRVHDRFIACQLIRGPLAAHSQFVETYRGQGSWVATRDNDDPTRPVGNENCIGKAVNGFLMTQSQTTLKDICWYIMLESSLSMCVGRFLSW